MQITVFDEFAVAGPIDNCVRRFTELRELGVFEIVFSAERRPRYAQTMEPLADYIDAWEAEHGAITLAELAAAAVELGPPRLEPPDRSSSVTSLPGRDA